MAEIDCGAFKIRVAGEGCRYALLPFGLVTAMVAIGIGLPEHGTLHLRAVPALAACGAVVGALRWWMAGRSDA